MARGVRVCRAKAALEGGLALRARERNARTSSAREREAKPLRRAVGQLRTARARFRGARQADGFVFCSPPPVLRPFYSAFFSDTITSPLYMCTHDATFAAAAPGATISSPRRALPCQLGLDLRVASRTAFEPSDKVTVGGLAASAAPAERLHLLVRRAAVVARLEQPCVDALVRLLSATAALLGRRQVT